MVSHNTADYASFWFPKIPVKVKHTITYHTHFYIKTTNWMTPPEAALGNGIELATKILWQWFTWESAFRIQC